MRIRIPRCFLLFLLVGLNSAFLLSQNQPLASDPEAVALATQAMAALTNGVAVNDATLTGNVAWIAGSNHQSGSALLRLKDSDKGRADFNLGANSWSDVRNDSAGDVAGEVIRANGGVVPVAAHNTETVAAWFSPTAIVSQFLRTDVAATYVGSEMYAGVPANHLRMLRVAAAGTKSTTAALVARLSTMDLWLDASSLLPLSLRFANHPEQDANLDIVVEIRFSDYRQVNGLLVPYRVQRLLQNGLNLDITITSAAFNSGLSDADFAIQATEVLP